MIAAPGIYRGVPMADYLRTHAVNASLLETITDRCPRAAWHESWLNPKARGDDGGEVQNAGTIAHSILLEGHTRNVAVIDPNDHPSTTNGAIPDGWTNKSIKAARAAAIAGGKTPVLLPQMRLIEAMTNEAFAFIESLKDREPRVWEAMQPGKGESELTMVWQEEDGTLCKIRPDRCSSDWRVTVDYKTGGTTAEPDTWGRVQMVKMGYYGGAAFYRRGIRALTDVETAYVFLVQEQEEPFLCSLVGVSPSTYDLGAIRVELGLSLWSDCMARNEWPGYPAQACFPEIPTYEFARWEGRGERIEGPRPGFPYEISQLWQKEAA